MKFLWGEFVYAGGAFWTPIRKHLRHEYGVATLSGKPTYLPEKDNAAFDECAVLLMNGPTPQVLDVVELAFHAYVKRARSDADRGAALRLASTLNFRLREHGCGFQFEEGLILRLDSRLLHAEAVRPALALLSDPQFAGPNEEFLQAHKHFRTGEYKAAMTEACKAFESVLKAICTLRGWVFDTERDSVGKLIQIVLENQLLPSFTESQLVALKATLESGTPTARNKRGAHGQGQDVVEVPEHFVAWALHTAASNIVLLVSAYKELVASAGP